MRGTGRPRIRRAPGTGRTIRDRIRVDDQLGVRDLRADLHPIEQEKLGCLLAAVLSGETVPEVWRDPQCRRSPVPRGRTRSRSAAPMAADVARGAGMIERQSNRRRAAPCANSSRPSALRLLDHLDVKRRLRAGLVAIEWRKAYAKAQPLRRIERLARCLGTEEGKPRLRRRAGNGQTAVLTQSTNRMPDSRRRRPA